MRRGGRGGEEKGRSSMKLTGANCKLEGCGS